MNFFKVDGKTQYDSAFPAFFFLDSSLGNREYRLEETGAREGRGYGVDKRR